jgi:hypothetical protein
VECDIVDDDGVAQFEMVKQKDFKSSVYSRWKVEQLLGFYYERPELFGIHEQVSFLHYRIPLPRSVLLN